MATGSALRAAGSKVVYFAGYKKMQDRYKVAEIEAASDVIVWCCDEGPGFAPGRPQDKTFVGNIVEAIPHYEDALRYRADYATAYFNLAIAFANTGDTDAARQNAERAGRLAAQQDDATLVMQVMTFLRALGPTS